jgi:predicted transposase YdaD
MTVLRESPWYQEILREGQARGQAEGEARGQAEGEVRGIISSIETSLEAKFGSDGLELMSQVSQISDLEQLKGILRRIIVASTIEDLQDIL